MSNKYNRPFPDRNKLRENPPKKHLKKHRRTDDRTKERRKKDAGEAKKMKRKLDLSIQ